VKASLVGLLLTAPLAAQQPGIDVRNYVFHISIPDTGSEIRGQAIVVFRRSAASADTLRLDLVGMAVDSVIGLPPGGGRRALVAPYDGRVLRIPLAALGMGDLGVAVAYHGVPRDGLRIGPNARGERVAFADNWPERARYWLPTVDAPADKAGVSWAVDVPAGWRVVANGQRSGVRTLPDGRRLFRWLLQHPIPVYTMVLGAGKLAVSPHVAADSAAGWVGIDVWTYPEDSAFADSVPFRNATAIVDVMTQLVGPFPYGWLSHVESSTRYGGMENSGAIFYAERPYVERTMGEGVVRHETAHQWFGDAVTEREWAHLWLSEGFASYFDLVVGARLHGDSVLTAGMRRAAATYFASPIVDRPVVDTAQHDPTRLLNANSYQKGAWVLSMLRDELGDSAFFRGIRAYYRVYRDRTAVSADFEREMERAAGRRLDWFFRQWLWQPGYPQLTYVWSQDSAAGTVHVHLSQVQPTAWGRFRLPRLAVRFEGPDGEGAEVRDVAVTAAETDVTVDVPFAPVHVTLDPDQRLLLTARSAMP
jgi:aminopeptidase N